MSKAQSTEASALAAAAPDSSTATVPWDDAELVADPTTGECTCGHMANRHDGDLNDGACAADECGCKAFEDADLADAAAVSPERSALERMRERLQHSTGCECGHALDDHIGGDGPCKFADGRGVCSCGGFKELAVDGSGQHLEDGLVSEARVTFRVEFDDETVARAAQMLAESATYTMEGTTENATVDALDAEGEEAVRDRLATALRSELAEIGTPSETLPPINPGPEAPPSEIPTGLEWTATFIPEGTLTSDRRAIAPGAIDWRELPLTLMAMLETGPGGHEGAKLSGRIDRIWRDGNLIRAGGVFDDAEFGLEVARLVAERKLRGVSVDLGDMEAEVGPRSDYFDEDGNWAPKTDAERAERSPLDLLLDGEAEEEIYLITKATIGMCTVCPFPAFAGATIEPGASLVADSAMKAALVTVTSQGGFVVQPSRQREPLTASAIGVPVEGFEAPADGTFIELVGPPETLTAAAAGLAPLRPPAEWFDDPELDELTPLTVTDDGRVFGHAWAWETCHLAFPGKCVTPPHSESDYTYFLLKTVETDEGELVRCGTITLDTPHAGLQLDRAAATAHYDNTGLAVADVTFGEDEHGGWFAGALRPNVDAQKVRDLLGATISGDWRGVNGYRELIALLAVNVPGFPVPRPRAALVAGAEAEEVLAMVAAGVVIPTASLSDVQLAKLEALRRHALGVEPESPDGGLGLVDVEALTFRTIRELGARARGEAA